MHPKIFNSLLVTLALPCVALADPIISKANHYWTGVYLGGFAGGASSVKTKTTEPLRLDNDTNWFRPYNNSYSFDTKPSFISGGTVGYNWKIGKTPFLVSVEGEYGYLNERGSSIDPNQIPYAALTNNTTLNTSSTSTNI